MIRFKVWARRPRLFDDLKAARAYAERYFQLTGNIVAVTVVRV